ncbi:GGDEF domain-containing protein [Aestuariispira insulae]|uniref:Diguanylate cyclase (GGDEF)-like protein n=1 Tax=Aestuariispira insulae TaxID=1461337 RepID=A0A3D9H388_9PROT|nr:GGDEF domain-containing protein [Aestuariispira insulae]RED43356.1 diguanylate cyclase (GGDEF)-like protein [Aestuariispira insulae]
MRVAMNRFDEIEELKTYISDLEMKIEYLEEQAATVVAICEELSLQKQILEIRKNESDYIAQHDGLTGLLNRRTITSLMKSLLMERNIDGKVSCIYFIDMDNFKSVNDKYGHAAGDEILVQFSNALKDVFNDNDVIGRIGGDEFIAVQSWRKPQEQAVDRLLETLSKKVARINESSDHDIAISASVGIVRITDVSRSAEDILKEADSCMYEAKKRVDKGYLGVVRA